MENKDKDIGTMEQWAKLKHPFDPVSEDGQGIPFAGHNATRLREVMEERGIDDPRFVTKLQALAEGWKVKRGAKPVELLYRGDDGQAQTLDMYSAKDIADMPSLDAMLQNAIAPVPAKKEEELEILCVKKDEEEEELVISSAQPLRLVPPVVTPSEHKAEQQVSAEAPDLGGPETLMNGAFVRHEKGEYKRPGETKPALIDNGDTIKIRDKGEDAMLAMFELAAEKGWTEIEVRGKPKMKSEAWLQAQLRGIDVTNYTPTEADKARLEELQEAQSKAAEAVKSFDRMADFVESQGGTLTDVNDLSQGQGQGRVSTVGKIEQKDAHCALQCVDPRPGAKTYVIHSLCNIEKPEKIKVGEVAKLNYNKDGKGVVAADHQQSNQRKIS